MEEYTDELEDFDEDYYEVGLDEFEDSDIDCPQCGKAKLKIVSMLTSPDDFENSLICPECGYRENE